MKLTRKIKEKYNETYTELMTIKKSVLFWNGVFVLALLLSAIFCYPLFMLLEISSSILAVGILFDGDMDKNDLWVFFTITTLAILVLFLIGYICYQIYINTIGKFNDWLDNK